jgi:integral membrane sensor domain MASE1
MRVQETKFMPAAGKKQSFWEKLQQIGGRVSAPELAYAPVAYAGYCVAARLDNTLMVQGGLVSAFSLTDAFLLVALLGPSRTWWIVLAGALPAHLFHELAMSDHTSAPAALTVFASNFFAALGAVALMRRMSLWPPRLQAPRDLFVFMMLGCALPSLIGTSLQVIIHPGQPPGVLPGLWSSLFFSKMASLAIAVPVAVGALHWVKEERRVSERRFVEGTALGVGILLSSCAAFGLSTATSPTGWALAGAVLSCLIWAAARFGVGGTSACLLLMGLCAAAYASHGHRLFGDTDPINGGLALDVFLVSISVPLLLLAARLWTRESVNCRDAGRNEPRFEAADGHPAEPAKKSVQRPACEDFRMRLSAQASALAHLGRHLRDTRISDPPILQAVDRLKEEAAALKQEFDLLAPDLRSQMTAGKQFEGVLTSFCRKFSASSNLPVTLSFETVAQRISTDVAWCCFRLVQAGLHYAASEAGATEAQVKIAGAGDRLFLALAENGTRPLPIMPIESWSEADRMKNYVESLSGEFRIAKRETKGTLVMVVLPL